MPPAVGGRQREFELRINDASAMVYGRTIDDY
jgi:hypothetical protein